MPDEDVAEGRATRRQRAGNTPEDQIFRVSASVAAPPDAYVAVAYRNRWFWIDDRDLVSERIFMFLTMFSSLSESGVLPQAPVFTVPAK